jgi:hypothetical protein
MPPAAQYSTRGRCQPNSCYPPDLAVTAFFCCDCQGRLWRKLSMAQQYSMTRNGIHSGMCLARSIHIPNTRAKVSISQKIPSKTSSWRDWASLLVIYRRNFRMASFSPGRGRADGGPRITLQTNFPGGLFWYFRARQSRFRFRCGAADILRPDDEVLLYFLKPLCREDKRRAMVSGGIPLALAGVLSRRQTGRRRGHPGRFAAASAAVGNPVAHEGMPGIHESVAPASGAGADAAAVTAIQGTPTATIAIRLPDTPVVAATANRVLAWRGRGWQVVDDAATRPHFLRKVHAQRSLAVWTHAVHGVISERSHKVGPKPNTGAVAAIPAVESK